MRQTDSYKAFVICGQSGVKCGENSGRNLPLPLTLQQRIQVFAITPAGGKRSSISQQDCVFAIK